MSPDEVLKKLEEMGIKTSRSTLLRFEKDGLIPKAKRGSGGRGQGRYSEYPEGTHIFFFCVWMLLKTHKYSKEQVVQGIDYAKDLIGSVIYNDSLKKDDIFEVFEVLSNFYSAEDLAHAAHSNKELQEKMKDTSPENQVYWDIANGWQLYAQIATQGIFSVLDEDYHEYERFENRMKKLEVENQRLKNLLKEHGINPD